VNPVSVQALIYFWTWITAPSRGEAQSGRRRHAEQMSSSIYALLPSQLMLMKTDFVWVTPEVWVIERFIFKFPSL